MGNKFKDYILPIGSIVIVLATLYMNYKINQLNNETNTKIKNFEVTFMEKREMYAKVNKLTDDVDRYNAKDNEQVFLASVSELYYTINKIIPFLNAQQRLMLDSTTVHYLSTSVELFDNYRGDKKNNAFIHEANRQYWSYVKFSKDSLFKYLFEGNLEKGEKDDKLD
jgi:hypothetical protein